MLRVVLLEVSTFSNNTFLEYIHIIQEFAQDIIFPLGLVPTKLYYINSTELVGKQYVQKTMFQQFEGSMLL